MQVTAKELAALISGRIVGNENVVLNSPAKIEEAAEGQITFLANPKYEEYLYTTMASAALVTDGFEPKQDVSCTLIYVEDVYKTLSFLLEQFGKVANDHLGISKQSVVDDSAQLAENVNVGPFTIVSKNVTVGKNSTIYGQVFIGPDVKIGSDVLIYSGVRIYNNCEIGNGCIIHANAVIGSDGFGFNKDENGEYKKVPQIGNVVLGDHVDIGANTVIDRATMGSTLIKNGAKLDNLIQIAHNVEIGANTVIAGQAGIAGSTKIGDDAMIGGQVGIAGHLNIAGKIMIQAGSGINKNIKEEGSKLYGYPALSYTQYLRSYAVFKELPEMRKRLNELEKILQQMTIKSE